jgi:hypothetical protein
VLAEFVFAALATAANPSLARCSPPTVILSEDDKNLTVRFWAGTPRRRLVEDNVRAAFKSACKWRLLEGATISNLNGVSSRRLFLENQPHATAAVLEADQRPDGSLRLVLSYPFVAADGSMHVPSATEIQEAIHCAVRGTSSQRQEASGRCLPQGAKP